MKDMQAVRLNEKVKRISTLVGAGGVAAALTGFTRWVDKGFGAVTSAWIFLGSIAILGAIAVNDLLVSEDQNGDL